MNKYRLHFVSYEDASEVEADFYQVTSNFYLQFFKIGENDEKILVRTVSSMNLKEIEHLEDTPQPLKQ